MKAKAPINDHMPMYQSDCADETIFHEDVNIVRNPSKMRRHHEIRQAQGLF
jgi:hypothetical protein